MDKKCITSIGKSHTHTRNVKYKQHELILLNNEIARYATTLIKNFVSAVYDSVERTVTHIRSRMRPS